MFALAEKINAFAGIALMCAVLAGMRARRCFPEVPTFGWYVGLQLIGTSLMTFMPEIFWRRAPYVTKELALQLPGVVSLLSAMKAGSRSVPVAARTLNENPGSRRAAG